MSTGEAKTELSTQVRISHCGSRGACPKPVIGGGQGEGGRGSKSGMEKIVNLPLMAAGTGCLYSVRCWGGGGQMGEGTDGKDRELVIDGSWRWLLIQREPTSLIWNFILWQFVLLLSHCVY